MLSPFDDGLPRVVGLTGVFIVDAPGRRACLEACEVVAVLDGLCDALGKPGQYGSVNFVSLKVTLPS